jgi:hypothetical protein
MSQLAVQQDVEAFVEAETHEGKGAEVAVLLRTKHFNVGAILSRMTFEQRVDAYRNRVFTRHELFVAQAREPELMPPPLNGELEYIAVSLADLD